MSGELGSLPIRRHRSWRRIWIGSALFALLIGISATAVHPDSRADPLPESNVEPDRILRSCLLPTPAGYVVSPQQHQRQETPFPVTPLERARLLFPHFPELAARTMGWALPDADYTASIPIEAKRIPRDLSSLPVLRFNNLEIHGERELRWRRYGDYDQWFLHDITRKLDALMTIHRETRRAYFFEYRWRGDRPVIDRSTESCYSCHASGPRLVRTYDLEKVDRLTLAEFNRKLLSYGAADFGESVDPERLGPALDDARCVGCHDGRTRGRLYAMHLPTMAYYLKTIRAMPPGDPMSEDEATSLIARHYQRHLTAMRQDIAAADPRTAGQRGVQVGQKRR